MKKIRPVTMLGMVILAIYFFVENLIITIPATLAVPTLLLAIVLIVLDAIKRKIKS